MPALYALGQHDGLAAGAARLHPEDFAVAFLDDLYVKTTKERARAAFDAVTEAVEEHAGVRTHLGKLRAWCRAGGAAPPGLAAPGMWPGHEILPPASSPSPSPPTDLHDLGCNRCRHDSPRAHTLGKRSHGLQEGF